MRPLIYLYLNRVNVDLLDWQKVLYCYVNDMLYKVDN